jgi:hypothetical protein
MAAPIKKMAPFLCSPPVAQPCTTVIDSRVASSGRGRETTNGSDSRKTDRTRAI